MLSTLVLKKTMRYTAKEKHYLGEVITIEKNGETPVEVFSVSFSQEDEELHCIVNHHSLHGIVYQRECSYSTLAGPYSTNDNSLGVLSPELIYLTQLYLSDAWLVSDKMEHYQYATEDTPRINQEIITMQKLDSLSEDMKRLNCREQRNILLDCLRERNFEFDLKRQRRGIPRTENIYINPIKVNAARYLICANYAYHKDNLNNAAGLAVLLHILCLNRSDALAELNRFIPPSLEIVLFDGASGSEGAAQYLWNMREDERKQILGVINLEIGGQGNLIVASQPKSRGNGKLFVSLIYAAKQDNRRIQQDLASPLEQIFEHENIPLITISSLSSENENTDASATVVRQNDYGTIDEGALQNTVSFVREIIRLLSYVKGDEIKEIPDMAYSQKLPKQQLISLGKTEAHGKFYLAPLSTTKQQQPIPPFKFPLF
jgi:hypothetical protein